MFLHVKQLLLAAVLPLFCSLALSAQNAETPPKPNIYNILDLGAKNDGSMDISDIVEKYTRHATIFLPAGFYKVSRPIKLGYPLIGEGYSRVPYRNRSFTWLISDINSKDDSVGVLNFSRDASMAIANLNIVCASQECGILVTDCRQSTTTFIDKVGIFNVRSYGIKVRGQGSRPIYLQNLTIFGNDNYPAPGVGILIAGPADTRLSNLEIMGTRIGLELHGGFHFGDNFHFWTGCLKQRDKNDWWRGTRSLVLDYGAFLNVTNFYPDTSFYAIETRKANCSADVSNIMYWEDASTKGSNAKDGKFFHGPGKLRLNGGMVYLNDHKKGIRHWDAVFSPNIAATNVVLRSNFPIAAENLKRLCLTNALPDYTVHYADTGFCKVADILAAAPTGACETTLTLSDGAAYKIAVIKDKTGQLEASATPLNKLCDGRPVRLRQRDGVVSVFVHSADAAPWSARLVTSYMNDACRPVNYAVLHTLSGHPRFREVLATLD